MITKGKRINIGDYGFQKIQVEVNNECNFACEFCPLPLSKLPKRTMDKDVVLKLLESFAQYDGIAEIIFPEFGEPLLNKNIWEYIDKCRSLGMRSCLVINGSLLTKENIDNLYMHRPDVLQISLVNIYPEKHHKLRNTTVEFSTYMDRITDAVAMFVDEKPDIMDIHTDIGIQTDNYSGFRGKKHLIYKKLGILDPGDPSINVTIRDIKPHLIGFLEKVEKKSSKFRLSREQVDKNIRVYYSKPYTNGRSVAYDFGNGHKIYYHPFFTGRKRNQWYPVTRGSCRLPFLGILADGRVTLCLQDYDANVTIGSILEDELGTVLERNKELIKKHKMHGKIPFEICRSCLGSPTRHGALMKNIRNTILSFLR